MKKTDHRSVALAILNALLLLLVACNAEKPAAGESDVEERVAAAALAKDAEDAYIFGLGPLAMYKWYHEMAIRNGSLNRLRHDAKFAKPGDFPGGSPNNDTYYGVGWLDISDEPYVVSLPDFGDRYFVFQLTDIYGYNFHNIGNGLSSGQKDAYRDTYTFALVPPGWEGEVPAGVDRVDSPVRLVNVLYRIYVEDEATDGPEARLRQQETMILPLSEWMAGNRESIQIMPSRPIQPYEDVIALGDGVVGADQRNIEFFVVLDNLIRFDPPWNEWDKQFVTDRLTPLGIGVDRAFDPAELSVAEREQFLDGQESGFGKVQEKIRNVGIDVNGWQYTEPSAGLYNDDFLLRAAMIYTGGMYPSMQVSRYANLSQGPNGEPLVGAKPMVLTFPGGDMPLATAFWSLTMYSMGQYDLVENPIDRYLIRSSTAGLDYDSDGSLTIYVQNERPSEKDEILNWLPAPSDKYFLLFRWYAPTDRVIQLDYKLPAIKAR